MHKEVFLVLICLVAIHPCSSVALQKNKIINDISHGVTDRDTEDHFKAVTDVTTQTVKTKGQNEPALILNRTAVNNSKISEQRAAGLCLNLNPEQEFLCRHAVIADFKLDQLYKLVNNLFKILPATIAEQLVIQENGGDCPMNVSRLTSDLRRAVTAVCLLDNVPKTSETVGGCCHSDSHIREEFNHFVEFLQTNVFQLLLNDHQMDTVEPVCVGRSFNVVWLERCITSSLQNTKQLITAIETRQCQFHS